jgi:hypothetical protein
MAGRPRLVHEGSPIIDEGGDDDFAHRIDERESQRRQQQTLGSLASRASATSTSQHHKPYKLKTRLVIGDVTHEDDAVMEVDDHAAHAHHAGHHHHGYSHPCNVHHEQHYYTLGGSIQNQSNLHTAHVQRNSPSPIFHNIPSPSKSPLVVIDGANIAYNYAESLDPSSSLQNSNNNQLQSKQQPNPHGIRLAIEYFLSRRCRVQAVVPTSWYRLRPRSKNEGDAKMVTDEVEELRRLREQGFLVACPPGDDDDAYVIALARREGDRQNNKSTATHHEDDAMMDDDEDGDLIPASLLGGYVLSNDFFHDAVKREEQARADHDQFYSAGGSSLSGRISSLREWLIQNRISYSFANVGQISHGLVEMAFLPNPRHPLIEYIEGRRRCFDNDL